VNTSAWLSATTTLLKTIQIIGNYIPIGRSLQTRFSGTYLHLHSRRPHIHRRQPHPAATSTITMLLFDETFTRERLPILFWSHDFYPCHRIRHRQLRNHRSLADIPNYPEGKISNSYRFLSKNIYRRFTVCPHSVRFPFGWRSTRTSGRPAVVPSSHTEYLYCTEGVQYYNFSLFCRSIPIVLWENMIESRDTNRLTIVPLFVDHELFVVLIHSQWINATNSQQQQNQSLIVTVFYCYHRYSHLWYYFRFWSPTSVTTVFLSYLSSLATYVSHFVRRQIQSRPMPRSTMRTTVHPNDVW
jgi:hypothetical protein